MKGFWFTGAIIFFVLILIVAFGNIQAQCTYVTFLFYEVGSDIAPTFTFFGISLLGVIAGIFLYGLFNSILKSSSAEEEESEGPSTM